MAETSKAHDRRVAEKFFDKYVKEPIIDIGVGRIDTYDGADPLTPTCDTWDKDNGDAHFMKGVADETYQTVYNSHLLEHLEEPIVAIQNWFRILKKGGHLIMAVPHRDLYERKKTLPSKWNLDHKFFILPDTEEEPDTKSLMHLIKVGCKQYQWELVAMDIHDSCTNHDKPEEHGDGEFQIQAIIKRLA
jgi:predicted SAM-dependent methyltransferase